METVHITRAAEGRHYRIATDVVTVKAGAAETSGRLLLLDVRVPAGGGPPFPHRHEYAEVFYVLEGEFEILTVDEQGEVRPVGRAEAGDSIAVPSWAWHNFRNVGGAPGRLLAVHSGARMEEFAREAGVPVADPNALPPSAPAPEERERLMAAVARYMEAWTPGASPRPPATITPDS